MLFRSVNDKVYAALIDLLVDICRRNGIPKLLWRGDKSLIGQIDKQNMTVHRWFHSGKSCPGTYLYERMGKIADDVNKRLGVAENKLYRVQIGAFSDRKNAENYLAKAQEAGLNGFVVEVEKPPAEPCQPEITIGCSVTVNSGATDYNGGKLASFVFNRTHTVKEVKGDRAVITYAGAIVAAVNVKDLTVV